MNTGLRRYSWELLLVVLIGLAFIWSSRLSPFFLNQTNLVSSAEFYVIFGLMAFGLMPIVLHGEIDISLASTLAVGSVLYAKLAENSVPVVLAMLLVLAVGGLLGLLNGALVAGAGLPSLAVTLGTLGAFRGLAFLIAGDAGSVITEDRYLVLGDGSIGPVPVSLVVLLTVGALLAGLLALTSFGRYSYAVGSNADASRMAGVSVAGTKIMGYVLGGVLSGLAGIIWVGQYQSARGDNADGSILFVVTAVVLGGVSIKGGSGRAVGVLLSLILLGTIQTGMKLANVPGTSQTLVVGLLLIASIGVPKIIQIVRGLQRVPVDNQSERPDAAEQTVSNAS